MSYCCDRARSITWGIQGGLPSIPQGVWLTKQDEDARCLGAIFSNVPVGGGDYFTRCSAGGGGFGDPLEREPSGSATTSPTATSRSTARARTTASCCRS